MENRGNIKTSKFKNNRGQRDRKCENVLPIQFHNEPSMKILPKMVEKPVAQSESSDSDFPALPGHPEVSPGISLNFSSSTSFSTVLSRKPQAQSPSSNARQVVDISNVAYIKKNPSAKKANASGPKNTSSTSTPANIKPEKHKTPVNNSKYSDSKNQVPNVNAASTCDTSIPQKTNTTANQNQVPKSEKKSKRKSKKQSKIPQGKVNTLTQAQYQAVTEHRDDITSGISSMPNIEDLCEYPALGLTVSERIVKVKQEPGLYNQKHNVSENDGNENQETVSSNLQLTSPKGSPLARIIKTSPNQEKASSAKKFNTPIEMSLVDMLSKMKIKPIKTNLKVQPTSVKREKISSAGKYGVLNSLDSSGPKRKRGKERELPRKPKLSKIKKVILKERVEKRLRLALISMSKMKEQEISTENTSGYCDKNVEPLENELQKFSVSDDHDETDSPAVEEQEVKVEDSIQVTTIELEEEMEQKQRLKCAKKLLHCRKFREYCNHFISEEIDTLTNNLLEELVRYQDRLFMKDPVKARVRKRYVCGLKEVTKNLKLRKLKLVIVAPDIEEINSEGGLNDALHCILNFCENYVTPLMFSLPRRKLGKVCKKKVPLSCVGVFNYEGAEEIYKQLMELVDEARQVYKQTLTLAQQNLTDEMIQILGDDQADHSKVEEMRMLFWQSQSSL